MVRGFIEEVEEVAKAPKGPEVGAFFDLDGTVLKGYSAAVFAQDQLRPDRWKPARLARLMTGMPQIGGGRLDAKSLYLASYRLLRGMEEGELARIGERLFEDKLGGRVYPEARQLIDAHQARGHTVALCSSASPYQVGPIARDLGVEHVLCTELEVADGKFTGRLSEDRWGPGKMEAAMKFTADNGIELGGSWFYANGNEDVPLLEAVGKPRPTNPDSRLYGTAQRHGWPVLRFTSRRRANAADVLRTVGAVGGLTPSLLAALPPALLNRDRRQWLNLSTELWTEWALAASHVKLDVVGQDHLWANRPAVFIYNHQSNFDPLIALSLIKRDVTGVAKSELARIPGLKPLLTFGDVVFVDRTDQAQAVAALRKVTTKLDEGISILVAPEGTRSPTGRLLPFKKGPFRIAMQGRVPVVPIVIRNSADVLPRGAAAVRPGMVDVAVLEPIGVEDWEVHNLPDRISAVRQLYVDSLADWPGDPARGRSPGR